jgi:TetR/AcrR family transcriptional repressor of mexJK operon
MIKENKASSTSQRELSKEKRRAAIIEIAKRIFLEKGYDGTVMSAIAQEMGGSKGTLWNYFTSKEELFSAVLENMTAAFQSFSGMTLNAELDTKEVLTRFCETFIARISSPEAIALQRLVVSQADRLPEVGRIFFERGPAINHMMLSNFLGRQMLSGALPVDDPGDAARMLLDLCTAGYHDYVFYGIQIRDEAVERQHVERIIKQFMRCYGPSLLDQDKC